MKWISVEEKLPEDKQTVLTYWAEKQRIQLQTYYKHGPVGMSWWLGMENLAVEDGDVTHWMPLPEAPPNPHT